MLKLNDKQQRTPTGGHQYHEYGTTFRGESYSEVVKKLREFRLNNNLNVGDPEQEVLRHYADHWPWMVRSSDKEPAAEQGSDYQDWRSWIQNTWKRPPAKFISTKEASERWNACLTCPHNVKKDWGTTKESEELKKRAFVLSRGITIPSGVGYCNFHKCDLGVFTFIDKVNNYSGTTNQPPANCWVKHEDFNLVRVQRNSS